MNNINTVSISDRLEFLEFRQQILFLKQPNHKAVEFANLSINQFLDIKNFVYEFESAIIAGAMYTIKDFEVKLFNVCPSIKTYPNAATLVSKILMNRENYDVLFSYNN